MRGQTVHQQIVSNAKSATNAIAVVLRTWDPGGHEPVEVAEGLEPRALREALESVAGPLPQSDDGHAVIDPCVNSFQEAVYLHGESVSGPFPHVAAGSVQDGLLHRIMDTTGIRHTSIWPLFICGSVAGSLTFHTADTPSAAKAQVLDAFARQTSLTLENAYLLGQLEGRIEELRETRRLMTAANEAARRQIAELLHGAVQTQLLMADFALRHAAGKLTSEPKEAERLVNEARERIDSVREHEIREASHQLHPSVINLGLGPAVRSLASRFEAAVHISVNMDPRLDGIGTVLNESLPMGLRLAAYRIIEESLVNAHRHGAAGRVHLDLDVVKDQELVLVVSDNGAGFVPHLTDKGLGFHTIDDYVDQAGGSWSVTSVPARGTTVTARFPIRPSAVPSRLERSASH